MRKCLSTNDGHGSSMRAFEISFTTFTDQNGGNLNLEISSSYGSSMS